MKLNKAPKVIDIIKISKNSPEKPLNKLFINRYDPNAATKSLSNKEQKETKTKPKDYLSLLLEDYSVDIMNHFKTNEKINIFDYSSRDLFSLQDKKYFNEKSRKSLYQWLLKNNCKWKLKDDTMFMTMNLMDRYISEFKAKPNEYKLIALSSYFIASKYEDIYPPYTDELSQISDFDYSVDEILAKEHEILSKLKFDILYVSSYKFLSFFYTLTGIKNDLLFYLAELFLEISLEDIEVLSFSQSQRALASLLIAQKILQIKWSSNNIRLYYDFNEKQIKNVQKILLILIINSFNSRNNEIKEKFYSQRYKSVSSFLDRILSHKKLKEKIKNDENINQINES